MINAPVEETERNLQSPPNASCDALARSSACLMAKSFQLVNALHIDFEAA